MPEKNKKTPGVCEVSPVGGKVELLRKRFVEKMSSESGVEVRSNGW